MEFRVRSVLEQAVEDLTILAEEDSGEFELNLELNQDIQIVLNTLKAWGNKLQKIEEYLDRHQDIPIEVVVNIKNIIYGEENND